MIIGVFFFTEHDQEAPWFYISQVDTNFQLQQEAKMLFSGTSKIPSNKVCSKYLFQTYWL